MNRRCGWRPQLWFATPCLICLCIVIRSGLAFNYRIGGNGSHEVHVQLTELKLGDFSHRGSLHVDQIELRSEENDRNGFFVRNPSDLNYPLWAAPRASMAEAWPKPMREDRPPQSRRGRRALPLSSRLRVRMLGGSDSCDVVRLAVGRFAEHAFAAVAAVSDDPVDAAAAAAFGAVVDSLVISVRNGSFQRYPHLDMREDYEVTIDKSGIRLVAQENWGVLRGLETIAQLIFVSRRRPNKFLIHENHIVDRPAYKYRGLMIDTSRHFIQKSTLLENLEAMALNKMNVFHWHIVDDQSFPYLSQRFPQLALKSAYAGGRYFYTAEDIREIVEFARLRGIRVVPEFDSPDHVHSWGHAMPDIVSWCTVEKLAYTGPLDPTNQATFQFLAEFYAEVAGLFPDAWLHLGMDEVSTDCWRLNATVHKFMQDNGIDSYDRLVVYYANRLSGIVENLQVSRGSIVWEDIIGKDGIAYPLKLPADSIVQVWITRDARMLAEWRKKYRLIRSEDWYLDHRGYGADWVKRYRFQPDPADLGGEACMWTEFQSDGTVTRRIWPSVSAVAERLWSGVAAGDPVLAASRIEEQNCRMQARGIRVGVAGGPGMCQAPVAPPRPAWLGDRGGGGGGDDAWGPGRSSDILINVTSNGFDYCWMLKWAGVALALGYVICRLIARRAASQRQHHQHNHQTSRWQQLLSPFVSTGALNRPERVLCCLLALYCVAWLIAQLLIAKYG